MWLHTGGNAFLRKGSFWWSIAAAISGHLYMVQSHRNVCLDRVMQLENSMIGDRIRKNIAEKYVTLYDKLFSLFHNTNSS